MFTCNGQSYGSVEIARAVAAGGTRFRCGWAVERDYPDGEGTYITDCRADAVYTERGWFCEVGHEHVTAEIRETEGWDYAGDAYDAAVIGSSGRTAVPAGPTIYIDDAEVAHVRQVLSI